MKTLRLGVALIMVAMATTALIVWILIARSMRIFWIACYLAAILSVVLPLILRTHSHRPMTFNLPFTCGLGEFRGARAKPG